jgi:hypothetical protein
MLRTDLEKLIRIGERVQEHAQIAKRRWELYELDPSGVSDIMGLHSEIAEHINCILGDLDVAHSIEFELRRVRDDWS